MPTWIALLRGINVGGKNKLPMKELVATLQADGFADVSTYIQSGNVVFKSPTCNAERIAAQIAAALTKSHGIDTHVHVVSAAQLNKAVAANPFPIPENEGNKLHLNFLEQAPEAPDRDSLDALKNPSESWLLDDNIFYLHAPDGIGRSKIAARAEKLLGVAATARNWRTVLKLQAMAADIA